MNVEISVALNFRPPPGWAAVPRAGWDRSGTRYLRRVSDGAVVGYDLAADGLSDAFEIRDALADILDSRLDDNA